jgi:hypothetical protein
MVVELTHEDEAALGAGAEETTGAAEEGRGAALETPATGSAEDEAGAAEEGLTTTTDEAGATG